ncbi:unnamed protein product [Choristocarpus tenellus]
MDGALVDGGSADSLPGKVSLPVGIGPASTGEASSISGLVDADPDQKDMLSVSTSEERLVEDDFASEDPPRPKLWTQQGSPITNEPDKGVDMVTKRTDEVLLVGSRTGERGNDPLGGLRRHDKVEELILSPHMVFIRWQLAVIGVLILMVLVSWRRYGSLIAVLYSDPTAPISSSQGETVLTGPETL